LAVRTAGFGPDLQRFVMFVVVMMADQIAAQALGTLLSSFSTNPLVGLALGRY
jgi:hypothetical protein